MRSDADLAVARLASIVDNSFDAIVGKDLNSVITTWNAAAERMFGYSADEAIGQSILMLIPPNMQSEEKAIIAKVRSGERVESYDTVRVRKDGSLIAVSITVSPIKDSDGSIVGASKIARDISAAKEAERRIKVLLRELSHRVKNQFAVILSIIRASNNRTRTPEEFEAHVQARIMALSSSHDLLVNSDWSGAGLFELAQEHLSIFANSEQVTLSGPLIMSQPKAVQNVGMALHELGTNAVKYGALSAEGGHIDLRWHLHDDGGVRTLTLIWAETSPGIREADNGASRHQGFGSIVLERVVPLSLNGKARLLREAGRIVWTLSVPAAEAIASGVLVGSPQARIPVPEQK